MEISKTILKALFLASFIISSVSVKSQEENNKPRRWGLELNGGKFLSRTDVSVSAVFQSNKSCYLGGLGAAYNNHNNYTDPLIYFGYRRYPGEMERPLKFYYQTFLYYSSAHPHLTLSYIERFVTANFGIGIEYRFINGFTAGISSNYGGGWNLSANEMIYTLFPLQISIGYKFNRTK